MKKYIIALGVALTLIPASAVLLADTAAAPQPAAAPEPASISDSALGQQQVEKLWAAFAKPDIAALDQFVAPGFQSLHEDGARDWPEERKLVADLKLTPYIISDYKVTRNGDVLVVTYQVKVGETIAAARLAKAWTPRLDVFQKTGSDWKLLSHVNVRKVTPSPDTNSMLIAGLRE